MNNGHSSVAEEATMPAIHRKPQPPGDLAPFPKRTAVEIDSPSSSTSVRKPVAAMPPTSTATASNGTPVKESAAAVDVSPTRRLGQRLSVQRDAVFSLLKQLAEDNEEFFKKGGWTVYIARLVSCCHELANTAPLLEKLVSELQEIAPKYDYNAETPGNGYSDTVVLHVISLLRLCMESRQSMMFRSAHFCKELEAFTAVIRFLFLAIQQVLGTLAEMPTDSLFPSLDEDYSKFHNILRGIESLDSSCFYGRPLGFQFSPSIARIFRFIGVILATYSLSWEKGHGAFGSLINSGRFIISPEQRAERIIKVTREADIDFCKGFWNLAELGNQMPKWFCPNMAVNELRDINWVGPITLESINGGTVAIPEPSAHTGFRPVSIRLLSACLREGLSTGVGMGLAQLPPPSPYLLFHCHGGGYVATSSKSHETYLRTWAKLLNCTVMSVDYSLAPENPFPRPTEEVLFAYAWAVKNPRAVGWTGAKVVLVGDSAGGNLVVSVALRLAQLGVKRKPDGIVPIYTPFLFQYLPSPSRLISFMDPLLHMGVVLRCVAAYTSGYKTLQKPASRQTSDEGLNAASSESSATGVSPGETPNNGHKSLQEYFDQVQKAQGNRGPLDLKGPIVSLVNLNQDPNAMTPTTRATSAFGRLASAFLSNRNAAMAASKDSPAGSKDLSVLEEETARHDDEGPNSETDEEEDANENNSSMTGVHIGTDPLRICLSSSIYDQQLVDYLQHHPLTRSTMLLRDLDGTTSRLPQVNTISPLSMIEQEDVSETGSETPNDGSPKSVKGTSTLISCFPKKRGRRASIGDHAADAFGSSTGVSASVSQQSVTTAIPISESQVHKRTLSQSLAETAVLAAGHALDNLSEWLDYRANPPVGQADKQKLERAASLSAHTAAQVEQAEAPKMESNIEKLVKSRVPRDPLISPLYASDELLKQLPPMWLIACHLDPLLDDTVSFARKLRAAGGRVASVDLLDSLPHGFLNFTLMSPEAREGAKLCLQRIRQALGMPNVPGTIASSTHPTLTATASTGANAIGGQLISPP